MTIAQAELTQAKLHLEAVTQEHKAEELRQLLEKGKPCPVCEQVVQQAPAKKKHPSLDQARALVTKHEKEAHRLSTTKSKFEGGLTELGPQLESKQREIEEIDKLIAQATAEIRSVLNKAPGPDVQEELEDLRRRVSTLQAQVDESDRQVNESRGAESTAKEARTKIDRQLVQVRSEMSSSAAEINHLETLCQQLRSVLGADDDLSLLNAEKTKQDNAKRDLDRDMSLKENENKNQSAARDAVAEASRSLEGVKVQTQTLQHTHTKLGADIKQLRESLAAAFLELKIDVDGDPAVQLESSLSKLQAEREDIQKRIFECEREIKLLDAQIASAAQIRSDLEHHRHESSIAAELAQALRADQFIDFIQREAYQRLAFDGSTHMKTLSSDRYSFGFEKNEFVVRDHWNADEERPVTTLSGGESFLASLALALALAEGLTGLSHGRGRYALESLFLDEGFGTLDPETLDIALQGVETLSATNRLVGIISHIPELSERMSNRIYVRKAVGGSTVEC